MDQAEAEAKVARNILHTSSNPSLRATSAPPNPLALSEQLILLNLPHLPYQTILYFQTYHTCPIRPVNSLNTTHLPYQTTKHFEPVYIFKLTTPALSDQ